MSGEFPKTPPGQALRDRLEAGRRIAQSCVANVFGDSANNAAMATSLGTVLAIGVYEGALLTRPGGLGRARFCFRYGAAQVLPSGHLAHEARQDVLRSVARRGETIAKSMSVHAEN